ncbi:MAG: hypothetical protein FJW20_10675 [Acidimicrobiia bacterium]|nr:hypothetical protein [Acidimicrobiia bacterium]
MWAAAVALAAALLWWSRERRLGQERRALRSLYLLSEEVFSATSAVEILRRLLLRLPRIGPITTVRMYLHNRLANSLEPVNLPGEPPENPVAVNEDSGVATCFRNRSLLTLSEPGRGPLLVPMLTRGEALGVLEIALEPGRRWFHADHQAATQHLGNQIATALHLLENQTMREQLFRTEKLAATGQLISGVASELSAPLETIRNRASQALEQGAPRAELEAIESEAARAADLLAHLLAFSPRESVQPVPLDLVPLLHRLVQFRQQEWKVRGVRCEVSLPSEAVRVAGAAGQLEQAFLDLLMQTERCAADGLDKQMSVSLSVLGHQAVVQITCRLPEEGKAAESTQVARGILLSHSGELRTLQPGPGRFGCEVLLPLADEEKGEGAHPATAGRRLTILVVEPDPAARAQTVRMLGGRKHRVVPVSNAEEGADLLDRLRFDLAVCAARLPGSNWIGFYERARSKVDGFLLLHEAYDDTLAGLLRGSEARLLRKPLAEEELDRALASFAVQ